MLPTTYCKSFVEHHCLNSAGAGLDLHQASAEHISESEPNAAQGGEYGVHADLVGARGGRGAVGVP